MVREIGPDDDPSYMCTECGETFDDPEEAESHESSCFTLRRM